MSKWQEWKDSLGESRPWHLLDDTKQIKDESLIQKRYSICQECPELISLTKQCKLCGCWMPGKTRLSSAECPVGKWKKEE
jgi:hypothetical protein